MNNFSTAAPPDVEANALSSVQKFVTTAQLVKTLVGLIIGGVATSLAIYNHFAKASELAELACKVVEQNEINNEMITTSRDIQSALKLLKESFDATADRPVSTQFMAKEIAATVDKIEKSLGNINQVRKASQNKSIMKDGKC